MYRRSQLLISGLGTAFVAYASVSIQWSVGPKVWPIIELLSLALAFILGYLLQDLRRIVVWACTLTAANFLPAAVTAVGWSGPLDFTHGLFGNPNYFGCALAICLAGAIAYHVFWFFPFAAGGLWYTQSRGAVVGAAMAVFIGIWRWDRRVAFAAFCICIALVVFASDGRSGSAWARIGVWQDTINHLTPFGHGWGSFLTAYSAFPVKTNMTYALAPHAYNDFLQLIFELGLGTIPLWFLIAYSLEAKSEARLILLTGLALGLTYFPLHIPGVGHFMFLALGHLAALKGNPHGSLETYELPLPQHPRWRVGV